MKVLMKLWIFLNLKKNKQKFIEIFGINLYPEAKKKVYFFVPGMVPFRNTLFGIQGYYFFYFFPGNYDEACVLLANLRKCKGLSF